MRRVTLAVALAYVVGLGLTAATASTGPFTMSGAYAPPEPSWSPDGKSIAYTAATRTGTTVDIVSLAGGQPRPLAPGRLPIWSPKGDLVAFVRPATSGLELWVAPAQGGQAHRLTTDAIWVDDSTPRWSRDGRLIAYQKYVRWDGKQGSVLCGEVCVVEVASGTARQLTRFRESLPPEAFQSNASILGWTTDGRVLATCPEGPQGTAGAYAIDPETGQMSPLWVGGGYLLTPPSPDGRMALVTQMVQRGAEGYQCALQLLDLRDLSITRVASVRNYWSLTASWPKKIAVAAGPGSGDSYVLTAFDLSAKTSRVLTKPGVNEGAPEAGPDGPLIAFYRETGGRSSLWVMRPDGGRARRLASCQMP